MAVKSVILKRPSKTAPLEDYLNYYIERIGWSQNKLAICSRIAQPQINKIFNRRIYNIPVDVLICICLALRLTKKESLDLLARAERAISPANECYDAYLELIEIYSLKEIPSGIFMCNFLVEADEYLAKKHLPCLPRDII